MAAVDEGECTESVPPLAACAGAFTAASGAFTADSTAAGAFTVEHYTHIHRIQHLASQHPLVAAVSSLTATASGVPSASAASGAPSSAPVPKRPRAPTPHGPSGRTLILWRAFCLCILEHAFPCARNIWSLPVARLYCPPARLARLYLSELWREPE